MSFVEIIITPPEQLKFKGSPDTEIKMSVSENPLNFRVTAGGSRGVGLISGGTTGQVLSKKTNNDYDTEWVDASFGGGDSVN